MLARKLLRQPDPKLAPTIDSALSARHHCRATPTLLKATLNQFTADAAPTTLRNMLEIMQQLPRQSFLSRVPNPDFRQTLIGRNFPGNARQELLLHGAFDSAAQKLVNPEGRDRQVWRLNPQEFQLVPM